MDKDPSKNKSTDQTDKTPVSDVPEQQQEILENSPEQKTDLEKIDDYDFDREQVIVDPETIGMNFDSDLIVNGQLDWSLDDERAKKLIDKLKIDNNLSDADTEKVQLIIEEARLANQKKVELFKAYIDDYKGKLAHSRVNPFGAMSPVSPSQAVKINEDGSHEVSISPTFIEQMKYLKDNCPDTTIVVPFYDDTDEKTPENDRSNVPKDATDYTEICSQLISQLGDGEGLTLEIGNETNVSHDSGDEFGGDARAQFASKVEPEAYAKFYVKVATELKAKYPKVKLSIAGTACFDEAYLREVLSAIKKETEGKAGDLVDVISYHPYGGFSDDGTKEGKYSAVHYEKGVHVNDNLSFEEQHQKIADLATAFGVNTVDIGEINFKDPKQRRQDLKKFLARPKKKGVITKIWPTATMPAA